MPILGNRLLRRQAITYLLRDDFTTDASAPLASPRPCEPGPGSLTLVQNDGQLAIASGKLTFPAQTTPAWTDQGAIAAAALARVAGRVLVGRFNRASGLVMFPVMWRASASLNQPAAASEYGIDPAGYIYTNGAFPPHTLTFSNGTDYDIALVLRGTGCLYFVKGGLYPDWTLVWVSEGGSATPLYPGFVNFNAAGTLDHVRVRDLPAPFTTDFGIATLNQPSPVSGSSYPADADGLYHLTITAPGTLANQTELRYRVQDAANYWTAYVDSAGALKLDSVAAGVATNRLSVAGVIAASATITLCVITAGSKHNLYTLSGTTWTKRGGEINVSHLDTQTTLQPYIGSGWSASNLHAWARTASAYAALG